MIDDAVRELESQWNGKRWSGIERTYTAEQVVRLRGSAVPEHTLARIGAERLWELLEREEPVRALGALTGGQAVQMVRAGLDAIYLSGWQVAADANLAGSTYPDQSLYPVNSVPSILIAGSKFVTAPPPICGFEYSSTVWPSITCWISSSPCTTTSTRTH